MRGKMLSFLAALVTVYLVMGLAGILLQDRLMYFPRKKLDFTPADFGLAAEEVNFSASDGVPLFGWYFPAPGSEVTLVYLHGNAGNISHRLPIVAQLLKLPAAVFLFDYRGYGESGGRPRGEKPLLDARAALDWVRPRGGADRKIVLFGESIGGSMALILAAQEPVDGVISLAAFTSTRGVARSIPAYRVFSYLLPNRYDALGAAPRVNVPTLFIQGTADEVIPFSHGNQLFAAGGGPKENFWISGGGHNDLFEIAGRKITERLRLFFRKL